MGKFHEEKLNIMEKYLRDISYCESYYYEWNFPDKKIDAATKAFAFGLDKSTILGFCDITLFYSGKSGYLFTDDKLYYTKGLKTPQKLWYDDIMDMEIINVAAKDNDSDLKVTLNDGTEVIITCSFLNKTPLMEFLNEMKDFDTQETKKCQQISYEKNENYGFEAAGLGISSYQTVNKQYDEEKFHARQGHGFAAERANTLYDKLTGHDANIVGDDNAKNGADRIVDGIYIQSKYCATGSRCVNECFEDNGKGAFRYMNNGKPMQIEVPSDKYDDAVKAMEEKIRRGQVKGVSNPEDAKNIIRKGHFTYDQARNIAKAGTIESLTYDAVSGVITATTAFGVTAMITLATLVWNGDDFDAALKLATYSGMKVGGAAFLTSVLSSQLTKAGLNSALVGSSEAIVALMGPKASAILINAFRQGANPIYGAAAMKSAAKLLRGNVITAGVTVVVLSSFDVANIFRDRISAKQLCKNMINTTATVGGGTCGWLGGAAIGSAILPVVGTVVGGVVGSMVAGSAAGKVSNAAAGKFIKDDADEMVKIIENVFQDMASEYLLSQKEAEKSVDKLREELDGNTLKDMFASADRKAFARELLQPIIERQISFRTVIPMLTKDQMITSVKEVLEEIADTMESDASLANA